MSLAIATYVPEGIVMASDSRQSITFGGVKPDGNKFEIETVNSDSVNKTFMLEKQRVGISSFGQDLLAGVPMASHVKRFSEEMLRDTDDVEEVANKLLEFFSKNFGNVATGFHICGYRKESKVSMPYVFNCNLAKKEIARRNLKPDGSLAFGTTWSGQFDVLSGLINPVTITDNVGSTKVIRDVVPIVWDAMALQDAIDFSIFAIQTTIQAIRFQARPKNVGGPIDVLLITPSVVNWIQHKELKGEIK